MARLPAPLLPVFLLLVASPLVQQPTWAKDGVIEIDSLSWNALIGSGARVADFIVAFKEFSHTEPQHWKELAQALESINESEKEGTDKYHNPVVVATVDCHNDPQLCAKYGVAGASSAFPQIKFFAASLENDKPTALFFGEEEIDEYVDFVLLQQRPQIRALKDLAEDFLLVSDLERREKLTAAESYVADLESDNCVPAGSEKCTDLTTPQAIKTAKYYVAAMRRILEHGTKFVEQEMDRMDVLVDSEHTPNAKKREFRLRLGCLDDFRYELADPAPKLGGHFTKKN